MLPRDRARLFIATRLIWREGMEQVRRDGIKLDDPVTRRRIVGCAFAGAMVAAPLVALLYGLTPALVVLTGALAATAYLTFDGARRIRPDLRGRLLLLAGINLALAIVSAVALIWRLRS